MRYHFSKGERGEADVVHLTRKSADLCHPVIREVFNYWEGLRRGRLAPLRSELDPQKLCNVIDQIFVLEYENPLDIRFRLAGMDLCNMLGMELRGMPARALFNIGHRDELGRVLDDMVTTPKIIELVLKTQPHKTPVLNARMLLLPMQAGKRQYSRILGCLVSDDPPLQAPVRFDIAAIRTTRIVSAMPPAQPHLRNRTGTAPSGSGRLHELQEPALRFKGLYRPKAGGKAVTCRPVAGKPSLYLVKDT
ncbi:PAS domain-containing protein [Neptunicoccus cionae]|uniref:PAS domain-containing protein n=1 Tax=Neptunicoccus cionae TaxID=2035344 RepID=UPI000C76C97F|nr:PAS domain-containing protein [Amylibacter cionae]PLS23311.1 hypothetical protein C0U40_04070 [Amylibacter cionae]